MTSPDFSRCLVLLGAVSGGTPPALWVVVLGVLASPRHITHRLHFQETLVSMNSTDWNQLTQTFCPQVRLSATSPYDDEYRPSAVDWYASRCTLLDKDDPTVRIVHPTLEQLAENPQPTRYLKPDGESVWEGSLDSATMYAHIRRSPDVDYDWIDIQYWFFYPYNGKIGFILPLPLAGEHVGDWEHVTVRLSNWRAGSDARVEAVFFAAHGHAEGKWLVERSSEPKEGHVSLLDGTHPVVYSAWHSHASYEAEGIQWRQVTGYFAQDFASGGSDWGPTGVVELVAVDADLEPAFPSAPWLAFSGRWGDSGASSPRGPSQQSPWSDDGSNGFYVDLDTLATFGSDWGSSRGTTSVALGVLGRQEVLAVGRDAGDNSRFQIFALQDDLREIEAGGADWGSSHGTTGVALGLFANRPTLGVSRDGGSNDRFLLYTMKEGELSPLASGGSGWGKGREATDIAIGALDSRQVVGVTRSQGSGSRFEIYEWADTELSPGRPGASSWGKSHGATGIAFGVLNGDEVVGVTRDGDGDRFFIYGAGNLDEPIATGGSSWSSSRSASSIAFGIWNDEPAVAVGRSRGDHSRFVIYAWDEAQNALAERFSGGSEWSSKYGCTDVAFGMINGEGVLAVSRSAGDGPEVLVYRPDATGEPVNVPVTGNDWDSDRSATSVAVGRLGGMDVVAYGRNPGDHSRGGVLQWSSDRFDETKTRESAGRLE